MKPLKLILSAFGSYGNIEEVDFEKIKQGLFLITGDTGSGKTTIFDGISYALYGETSGQRRDGEMMRSQYASDDKETYVEFTFDESGKTYRVRRNPSYQRRSRRKNKDGEYAQAKTGAGVELILPDGKVFPGKVKETDRKIIEIIGMDMNQFSQVSMISQGDFMKLLLASSKERKEIFSRIFPTQIYSQIQKSLSEQEKAMAERLEGQRMQCQHEIDNVRCIPESTLAETWETEGKFSEVDSQAILDVIGKITEEALQKEEEIRKEIQDVSKVLEAKKYLVEKQLQEKKLELETTALSQSLEQEEQELNLADGTLKEIQTVYDSEWPEQQKKWLFLQEELGDYDRLDEYQKNRIDVERNLSYTGEELKKYEKKLTDIQQNSKKITAEQEGLKDSGTACVQAEQVVKNHSLELEKVQKVLGEKSLWDKYLREEEDAKKETAEALCKYQTLSAGYDHIYGAFIESQAGLMARDLKEGEPCPVCGAIHHPLPNIIGEEHEIVDRTMVEKARQNREEAEKLVEKSREAGYRIGEKGVELKSRIFNEASGWLSNVEETFEQGAFWKEAEKYFEECKKQYDEAEKQWKTFKEAKKQFEINDRHLKELEEQQRNLQADYTAGLQKEASLKESLKNALEKVKELQEKLQFPSKGEALSYEKQLQKTMDQLSEALKSAKDKTEVLQKKMQTKQGQMEERIRQQEQLKKEIMTAEESYRASLTDERNLEAETRRSQLLEDEKIVYSIRQRNEEILKTLKKIFMVYGTEQENYRWLRHLSQIANGQAPKRPRIDFQTYMQRRYFQQIVYAANRRLGSMSGNQFLLECRGLENLGRQGEVGLDLDVYSMINDRVRDVKTLSGGESFMAALSLALGMADVIQQEAGKIHVDTLFIDEGFGSLDERARNQAVEILNELAGTDRLVGIISHVSELKEQIGRKIIVEKRDSGSHILMDS